MRDKQVATFLEMWSGFRRGVISSGKLNNQSSLSQILESKTSDKYYLSPTACRGIIRRAEKRGKELPPALMHALKAVAQDGEPTSWSGGGMTSSNESPGQYWDGSDTADTLDASNASNASKQQAMPEKRRFQAVVTPVAFGIDEEQNAHEDQMGCLKVRTEGGGFEGVVAFDTTQITSPANYSQPKPGDACHPLASKAHPPTIVGMQVRRLTPEECEALQGFPRGYTKITPKTADGPRYKALGNSFAVPVIFWIGERIQEVEKLHEAR